MTDFESVSRRFPGSFLASRRYMERLYSTNIQVIGNHYVSALDVLFWKYSRLDSATTI